MRRHQSLLRAGVTAVAVGVGAVSGAGAAQAQSVEVQRAVALEARIAEIRARIESATDPDVIAQGRARIAQLEGMIAVLWVVPGARLGAPFDYIPPVAGPGALPF